ncbi:tetratricopeptide repeat protein [Leptospira ilyithenensis]|uniref:Tetratricopeptide repeat protein n=1 Tax=Leptospira ilyithenensis TaxID=2484901 RepID=A0A4R9LTT8_9LEPT|nr:hypothetical protein [Leptospira ilyithenensis]TGN10583.1 hypothetical protein EHS11_09870 [Leptospira ilyithenensis]
MTRIIILFTLISFALPAQTSTNSNKKGIEALYKKDYPKAIEYFQETLKSSPTDAFANYNLACTYSILLSQCEDAYGEDEIYKLLQKAIKSKPAYKSKLLSDQDLEILRGRYRFNEVAGIAKKVILTKVIWYGPSPGAYGPMDQFTFSEDGTFVYTRKTFEDGGALAQESYNGYYSWETDSQFQIRFKEKSPLSEAGQRQKSRRVKYSEGTLEIQDFEHTFSDSSDRCSA